MTGEEIEWTAASPTCSNPKRFYDCDAVRSYLETFPQGLHASEAAGLLRVAQPKLDGLHLAWKGMMAKRSADAARAIVLLNAPLPTRLRDLLAEFVWNCAHGSAVDCLRVKLAVALGGPTLGSRNDFFIRVRDVLAKTCADLKIKGCKKKAGDDYIDHHDSAKAIDLFQQGCTDGDLSACEGVGWMYAHGEGTVDPEKAIGTNHSACDAGSPPACLDVANAYSDGKPPVPRDLTRASELYEWGCDTGYGDACANLAINYRDGIGVTADTAKAYGMFRKACDDRSAAGCKSAERMYDAGVGLPLDEAKKRTNQVATNRKMEAAHPEAGALFPHRLASGEVADKDCRLLGFDLIQKLPEPHMYEGAVQAVGCGNLGCLAPAANFLLRTKVHEFNHLGEKMICVRPEETWTTVTTVSGFTEARVVLEESSCKCPM